jgi:hypothetical protein
MRPCALQRYYVAGVAASLVTIILLVGGCAPSPAVLPGEVSPEGYDTKVRAEAYLFDAKLRRDGKVNSFRLEVFQTDSVLGLGGRGYLGKGILKGRVTHDSLTAYFPTSNEYVRSTVAELMESTGCGVDVSSISLVSLFRSLPDSVTPDSAVTVLADYEDENRATFVVSMRDCWRMDLVYDRQEPGWRVRSFDFSDGEQTSLRAKRREYRQDAEVRASKFMVTVPAGALQIKP